MNRLSTHYLAALAGVFLLAGAGDLTAQSAVPDLMTYQAFVTDSQSPPVPLAPGTPANYVVNFRIYGSTGGNDILWAESQTVTIFEGNFSVLLGNGQVVGAEPKPAFETVFTGADRYMGITVGANPEFTPRQRILSNAYAFRARVAENVGGVLSLDGTNVELTNGFTAGGASTIDGNLTVEDINVDDGTLNVNTATNTVVMGGSLDVDGLTNLDGFSSSESSSVTGDFSVTGNVGIGRTDPSAKLDIVVPSGTGNGVDAGLRLSDGDASFPKSLTMGINITGSGYGYIQALREGNSYTPLALNQNGGNVGIGTADPGEKLDVVGNIKASGTITASTMASGTITASTMASGTITAPTMKVKGPTGDFQLYASGPGFFIYDNTTSTYAFTAVGGNVGIGRTDPSAKLDIVVPSGTGDGDDVGLRLSNGVAVQPKSLMLGINTTGNGYGYIQAAREEFDWTPLALNQNGGNVGIGTATPSHKLHVNGVARSTQSSWATTSDRRAKRNITSLDASNSMERLKQIRPVTFEYLEEFKATHQNLEGIFTGFIAQEIEEVFPRMVTKVKESIGDNVIEDFRTLNTGEMLPHLVVVTQSQQTQIEKLQTENTNLRQRLATLEAKDAARDAQLARLEKLLDAPAALRPVSLEVSSTQQH